MSNLPTHSPEALSVNPAVTWDGGDSARLRTFLYSNPKVLQYLASQTPKISGSSMEAVALSGAAHAGYENLFRVLSSMISEANTEPESPFISGDAEDRA